MAISAAQTDGHHPPDLTSNEQHALQDLWRVYDANYEEIGEESERALAADPEFGPLIQGMPREQMQAQSQRSRDLLRRAIVGGDWEPYLSDLHEQGSGYAQMGISFIGWYRAVGVVRHLLMERLTVAYPEPDRLVAVVAAMDKWFDNTMGIIGETYLNTKEQTILRQQDAIRELSTPVLTLMDGLLLLPVVGVIDSHRARQMTDQLLQAIHKHRAKVVVIDITGVAAMDTMVANHLIQAVDAARLLGASAIVSGLSADVAQTVVRIGVDLSRLHTVGDLQGGVSDALRRIGFQVRRVDSPSDTDGLEVPSL
jgi:rsbT co-antagonist protein RsbR